MAHPAHRMKQTKKLCLQNIMCASQGPNSQPRPTFQVTADHLVRPIMVPRDVNVMPWHSGYAEAINAGKSLRNEDQVKSK